MRRRVDTNFVRETSKNIKNKIEELKKMQEVLYADIAKISECYQGIDADIITENYQTKVNSLNNIVETFEKYTNWFDWLSDCYRENLNNSVKNISSSSMKDLDNIEKIEEGTLKIYSSTKISGKDNNVILEKYKIKSNPNILKSKQILDNTMHVYPGGSKYFKEDQNHEL